jgi:CRP-like cAMP-binding protein
MNSQLFAGEAYELPQLGPIAVAETFARRLGALYPLQMHELSATVSLLRDVTAIPSHHEILVDQKVAGEAMVLLEGLACHYRVLDNARRQMTGFVVPGDFCDYGFLSSSPVRQCVMSLGPAVIARVELTELAALADKLPNVLLTVMRGASVEQACARELVVSLGARDALQRMAHYLCEMYSRLNAVGLVTTAGQFDLPVTQAELGEALGLSTVHVNRTIQQLRKKGLITMGNGSVVMRDFAGLAAISSFDGQYLHP